MKHIKNRVHACKVVVFGSIILAMHSGIGAAQWVPVDFDAAMKADVFAEQIQKTDAVVGIKASLLYSFFKELYDCNKGALDTLPEEPRIPKIIHHIWLGSPVPEELKKIMKSWHLRHPGWGYKLWTDQDAQEFPLYNRELYESTSNYGQKSDILRYEILYHIGGVYVDVDTECLRPVDILHYLFDLYVGIQPLDSGFLQLGIGVLAAAPKHPLLKRTIISMKENAKHVKGVPAKTGPVHFTKIFYAYAGKNGLKDIALPPLYFYPLGAFEQSLNYALWKEQGSFTVHHWAKTWMPKEYRRTAFKTIKNGDSTKDWKV